MRQQPYEHLSSGNFQSQSAPMSQILSKTSPPATPLANIANLLNSPSSLPAIGYLLGNFLKPSGNSTAPPFNNRPNSPAPNSASTHANNSPTNPLLNPSFSHPITPTSNSAANSTYNSTTNTTNGFTNNSAYGRPNIPATYASLPTPPPLSSANFCSPATNNENSNPSFVKHSQNNYQEKNGTDSYKQNREQTQTLQNEEFYPSINPQFALETLLNPKKQPQQRASGLENNHTHVLKQMQLHNEYISRLKRS